MGATRLAWDGEVEPGVCCTYVGYRLGIIYD